MIKISAIKAAIDFSKSGKVVGCILDQKGGNPTHQALVIVDSDREKITELLKSAGFEMWHVEVSESDFSE